MLAFNTVGCVAVAVAVDVAVDVAVQLRYESATANQRNGETKGGADVR